MANYDNFSTTFAQSRKNLFWPELDTILEDIATEGYTSVLDIGCGSGRFLEFFQKKFGQLPQVYCGVDNSEGMILEAKKAFPLMDFVCQEMQNITQKSLQNTSFDAIVLLASFHHLDSIRDRKQVLQNLSSILSPKGKIYMTNWNLRDQEKYQNSQISPGEFRIKIGDFDRYYHGFTLSELEGLFLESGFEIMKNEIFGNGRNFLSIIKNPQL